MAIDPKAAAAAAQAAAEAARAAAEAAAAAAASADTVTAAKLPTLSETTAQQALRDTEAAGAGDGQLDGTSMASVLDRDLSSVGGMLGDMSGRDSLLELPGLDSALADRYGGIEGPTLTMPGTGGAGSPANWASVATGGTSGQGDIFTDWISGKSKVTGSDGFYTYSTLGDTGDFIVHFSTDGTERSVIDTNSFRASVYSDDTKTDYVLDHSETWVKVGEYEIKSNDNGPIFSTHWTAADVTAWFESITGSDEIVLEEDESSAGSSGVSRPAPDEYDGYSGDWQGVLPIGPGSGDDDLVGGATGNTGSSGGGGLGPQGGGWAINPGSEGFVAGRETDLRDAEAWYGGISQPGDPTLEVMAGDPAMLDQGIQVVEPETINPGSGDADTADSGAQASTAYRTMAAPAGSAAPAGTMPASDGAAEEGRAADGPTDAEPDEHANGAAVDVAGLSSEEPTDLGLGMPGFGADDDMAGGAGQGRGREFGQEQGQGRGHGRKDDEADDLGPE